MHLSTERKAKNAEHQTECLSVGRTPRTASGTPERLSICRLNEYRKPQNTRQKPIRRANVQDSIRNTREKADLSTERRAKIVKHQTKRLSVGRTPRTVSGTPERKPICRLNERRRMPNTRQNAHLSGERPERYHTHRRFIQTTSNNPKQQQAPEATHAVVSGACSV